MNSYSSGVTEGCIMVGIAIHSEIGSEGSPSGM